MFYPRTVPYNVLETDKSDNIVYYLRTKQLYQHVPPGPSSAIDSLPTVSLNRLPTVSLNPLPTVSLNLLPTSSIEPSSVIDLRGFQCPEPLYPIIDVEHVRGTQLLLYHGDRDGADSELAQPDTQPAFKLSELHLPQGVTLHAPRVGQPCPLRQETEGHRTSRAVLR